MKIRVLLLLLSITFSALVKAQDSSATDHEQKQLQLCYMYSNELGYDIETIKNPELYEVIKEWIGTPYRYSGDTKNGIDCSGFVCTMYRSIYNRVLSGTAKDLYEKTDHVSSEELSEGDLVFFKIKRGRISHVGIYLGSNKFVHASTHNGVIISDLDETYYKKYFYKGGKINR